CRPTAAVTVRGETVVATGVMMPRRSRTRAQDRAARIDAERRLNEDYVAERDRPPPF
ncbi:HNH endonuclease, partial [Mycolicibacterium sp. KC 300]|nr:HNH endonuclease [Mycolicibacterium arseniciresistens]